jgi:hypothetical protein
MLKPKLCTRNLRENPLGSPCRYRIDTHDAGGDTAYLPSGIDTIATEKSPGL